MKEEISIDEIVGYLEVMMEDCSLEQAIQRAIDTYGCSHEKVIEALETLSGD